MIKITKENVIHLQRFSSHLLSCNLILSSAWSTTSDWTNCLPTLEDLFCITWITKTFHRWSSQTINYFHGNWFLKHYWQKTFRSSILNLKTSNLFSQVCLRTQCPKYWPISAETITQLGCQTWVTVKLFINYSLKFHMY